MFLPARLPPPPTSLASPHARLPGPLASLQHWILNPGSGVLHLWDVAFAGASPDDAAQVPVNPTPYTLQGYLTHKKLPPPRTLQ